MQAYKYALVFLGSLIAFGMNSSGNVLTRMGVDHHYIVAALIGAVMAWGIGRKHIVLIIAVLIMAAGVNAPAEFAEHNGYNRDYLLALMIAISVIPFSFGKRAEY